MVRYKSIVIFPSLVYACLRLKWSAWEVYVHDLWNWCRWKTDAALVGADTSRGTRVYAFSSVAPRKKLGIGGGRSGGAEVGASEKGENEGGMSSFQFDRFARRAPISDGFLVSA